MLVIHLRGMPLPDGKYQMRCRHCGMNRICEHSEEMHYCGGRTTAAAVKPTSSPPALAREADTVSWLTKAKNFATATAKHIAAGMPTASDEEILRRWTICQGCEFLKNDACSKCGCPVARDRRFVSKLAWADQSCPVGKWGPASA